MYISGSTPSREYAEWIVRALATPGGHLSIGRGGFSLHYDNCRLSGYDCETAKAECIAAGLPVIDSRRVPFGVVWDLAVHGQMIAVGEHISDPPYHAFSFAPLAVVAEAYRKAGAEVINLPAPGAAAPGE
jgi:hypothetical protein